MNIQFLVGPLVGAIIGGITNSVAIKMLFRPINPIKIGKYTVPFTPGVIPKEKERIASKVAAVVSDELLNEEVLKEWLLKEEIMEEIKHSVQDYFNKYAEDHHSINDKLTQIIGEERTTFLVCESEELITEKIHHKLVNMEIGHLITERVKGAFKSFSKGYNPILRNIETQVQRILIVIKFY